ncbi:hypothetical protein [Niabella ginsengisoli]|uniref:Uncharacterized protein n=1 Tax=Niabella ginsengisoli TaxID=522298 RepID=A0ABS9SH97_9BACT|nr:hypothetical protein [Niabella ginsengisoli]MCH5597700.1 hypothetical protein [Niabella ginsengisoli]
MDKIYHISGYNLKANLQPHTVHLVANYALRAAMRKSLKNVEELAKHALSDHKAIYGERLGITVNSLVTEILGHAYAYKILLGIRKIGEPAIIKKLSLHACSIDCGDKAHDSNRWFWDMCGYFKPLLFFSGDNFILCNKCLNLNL